ncbi:cytochrome P450 [Mycena latifolia]|nr:cytochrome P450 [Mycena latifolia]
MIPQILLPLGVILVCYGLVYAVPLLYCYLTSPLRHLVGPKSPSLLFGNFKQMTDDPWVTSKWRNKFGTNFMFKGLFSISELYTADLKAINHIVNHSSVYQKVPTNLANANRLLGRGILGVELEEHKRHNPAFGVAQIRDITEVFVEKSVQLRNIWASQLGQDQSATRIEVLSWLRHATLDILGQACTLHCFMRFTALETNGKQNELNQVFSDLFHSPHAKRYSAFRRSQTIMPILKLFPGPGTKVFLAARSKMHSISSQIVSNSKANIKATQDEDGLRSRRDLLSVLLKANLSPNVPENQRLTDDEVIAQIPAFFVAGHETTSSATAWALHALSMNTAAQVKLRDELLSISTDNPTMDELNSLPYLEMVVRESMRVHAPFIFVQRMAMEDDVLPLAKPYLDKYGKSHDSLPIPKGQKIHIPILGINTDKEVWGEDATEFKPERWAKVPEGSSAVPSAWANLLTFFAGPHNCIGSRFALVEMKALLFTLIRAFEFAPAVSEGGIVPTAVGSIQRPTALAATGMGSGLPLIVTPVSAHGF